jgi:WD40 repeat protein
VWDVATGASLTELKGNTDPAVNLHTYPFLPNWSASFSPDGTRIVTLSWDYIARVWDAESGAGLSELKGHTQAVLSASFSPDGTRIVTASGDGTARVWDAVTGASLAELKWHDEHWNAWLAASFSPDGKRIVTTSMMDETARVWDSVPYRERFPVIERTREARTAMQPRIQSLLSAGMTLDQVAAHFAGDSSLAPEERTAVQALLFEIRQERVETKQ